MRAKPITAVAVSIAEVARPTQKGYDSVKTIHSPGANTKTWARIEPIDLGVEYVEVLRLRTWLVTVGEKDRLWYGSRVSIPHFDSLSGKLQVHKVPVGLRIDVRPSRSKDPKKILLELDAGFDRIVAPISSHSPQSINRSISLFSLLDEDSQLVIGGLLRGSDLERFKSSDYVQRIKPVELGKTGNPNAELVLLISVHEI